MPIGSISASHTSPALIHSGGVRAPPIPDGVPVAITQVSVRAEQGEAGAPLLADRCNAHSVFSDGFAVSSGRSRTWT